MTRGRRWAGSAFGVVLIAAGLGLYGTRWWLRERLPLLDDWPVLLLAAPALLLAGSAMLVASRSRLPPDDRSGDEPDQSAQHQPRRVTSDATDHPGDPR